MPERITLECDAPKCGQEGRYVYVGVDPAVIKRLILCDEHESVPLRLALQWAAPAIAVRVSRAPARPQGANRARLESIRRPA